MLFHNALYSELIALIYNVPFDMLSRPCQVANDDRLASTEPLGQCYQDLAFALPQNALYIQNKSHKVSTCGLIFSWYFKTAKWQSASRLINALLQSSPIVFKSWILRFVDRTCISQAT